jgi:sterol-4alpha-carboxylate 3-dehydrogenase (decarboxylating)
MRLPPLCGKYVSHHYVSRNGHVSWASQSGATCIVHTASPHATLKNPALYWKVNVEGTKAVIAAAQATGVRKLVYTSSAGVVFNGGDIVDIDERLPPPDEALDSYNHSKAVAEAAVLAANGEGGLLTVALRPAGIFGCVRIAPSALSCHSPRVSH